MNIHNILRNALSYFKMIFYNSFCKGWIVIFGKRDNRCLRYYVSLCLIFKNEAPFLKEWLDYHLVVGIDHFYLYNNNSDDNYLEILKPYIEKDIVTLIDYPYEHAQIQAYQQCYQKYRNDSNWIGFIDADEFICPKYKNSIGEWLLDFNKFPAVNIHWLIFGSNGKLYHDYSKGVIEQYIACWKDLYKHGKCFVNTRFEIANYDKWYMYHHTYMYIRICGIRIALPAVNQFGYICTIDKTWGGGSLKIDKATIQINHYLTKARDIYEKKMNKSDAHFKSNPRCEEKFIYFDKKATLCNYHILRFLSSTKSIDVIL